MSDFSFVILEDAPHRQDSCDLCKAAAANRIDHYAIGLWRIRMGRDLGLSTQDAQALSLETLVNRWHKHHRIVS